VRTIPSVRRGKPEEREAEYEMLDMNGVTVYAHESLKDFGELVIDKDSTMFGSRLVLRNPSESSHGCCG